MGWAGTEFEKIDWGDEQRNKRAIRLVERSSVQPTASVLQRAGTGPTLLAFFTLTGNWAKV